MGRKGRRLLAFVAGLCSCTPTAARNPQNPPDLAALEPAAGTIAKEDDLAIPIGPDDAVWGTREAPVTVVLFSDFECGPCAELEIGLDELKDRWGPRGLRIVFKHFPQRFHPNARDAAEASQGVRALAGNDAFWTFHGLAFTTEDDLRAGLYEEWASRAGVEMGAFRSGIAQRAWASKVQNDEALAAKLGVTDVPALFVNGATATLDSLPVVFAQEKAKAQEKLDAGTAPDAIYRTMLGVNGR